MNGSTRERSNSEYGAPARTNERSSHAKTARNLEIASEGVVAKVRRDMHDDDEGEGPAVSDHAIATCLNRLGNFNASHFPHADQRVMEAVSRSAGFALEAIAGSNAPYHDVDHTVLATHAGQAILEGLHLSGGGLTPRVWGQFTVALLFHDIGYVRGICRADRGNRVATGKGNELIEMPAESTDAALSSYHLDRGLMFIEERFAAEFDPQAVLRADVISGYVEMTRFPFPLGERDADPLAELIRAADLIGQLGDPRRRQKCAALFREFEEIGLNARLGYRRPDDIIRDTAGFYRKAAAPRIQKALACLRLTREGSAWIAQLQANVGERIL
jgi:hypothetical protein